MKFSTDCPSLYRKVDLILPTAAARWNKACTGQIDNRQDGFAAFGIGAAAGALGAVTGGAAFATAGGTAGGIGGFLAGTAGGAAGSAAMMPVQNVGNHLYFGDPLMSVKDYALGVGLGALTGGITNGTIAALKGNNFWAGKNVEFGRGLFSVNNTPTRPDPGLSKMQGNAFGVDAQKGMNPKNVELPNDLLSQKGTTVIGETMGRVESVASKMQDAVILNDMPNFTGNANQVTSKMMQYNRQWILGQMRSGRSILNLGVDPNRISPSIFYQMEKNMIKNYQILHPNTLKVIMP